jgi:hypothetical protein
MRSKDRKDDERHLDNQRIQHQILEQTTMTNGRVTKLENWVERMKGAWWLLATLGAVAGFATDRLLK